jgi:hypothetical protein
MKFKSRMNKHEAASWVALQKYRNRPEVFRIVECSGLIPRIVSGSGFIELRWLESFCLFQVERQSDDKWVSVAFDDNIGYAIDRLSGKLRKGTRKYEIITEGDITYAKRGPEPEGPDAHVIDPEREPYLPFMAASEPGVPLLDSTPPEIGEPVINLSLSGDVAPVIGVPEIIPADEIVGGIPEKSLVAETKECYCDSTLCPTCSKSLGLNIP